MTRRFTAAIALLVTAFAFGGGPAFADVTKSQCIAANGDGQSLRRDHKLAEAREQFRLCADPKCPGIVAADCTKRLDELEAAQPTIIFDAKDGSGHDLSAVTVTIDGRPFAMALDGTPLPAEPGEHSFTFTVADQSPQTQTFVLKEGDKARHERIVIGSPPPAAPPTKTPPSSTEGAAPPEQAPEPASKGLGTQKIVGLAVGGVGVVGIAVGSVFGALTASAASQQKSDCSTSVNCTNRPQAASEHSTGSTDSTVSTVAFIAGGALLVTGAVVFFTAKHDRPQTPAAALLVAPTVGPNSAGMFLRGEF